MDKDLKYDVICVGTGEIGQPWYELVKGVYEVLPVDPIHYPDNVAIEATCDYLHICIPGNLSNFNELVIEYTNKYKPKVVLIQSTVTPGTIGRLNSILDNKCVFSPMNGKHAGNNMKKDQLRYTKFVGADDRVLGESMCEHLRGIGIPKVRLLSSTLVAEWMKVLSTTYFGYMIAWAQEVERIADELGLDPEELSAHVPEQEDIIPPHYSGVIGGHCVMTNIELINTIRPSKLTEWIEWSNDMKKIREEQS